MLIKSVLMAPVWHLLRGASFYKVVKLPISMGFFIERSSFFKIKNYFQVNKKLSLVILLIFVFYIFMRKLFLTSAFKNDVNELKNFVNNLSANLNAHINCVECNHNNSCSNCKILLYQTENIFYRFIVNSENNKHGPSKVLFQTILPRLREIHSDLLQTTVCTKCIKQTFCKSCNNVILILSTKIDEMKNSF